MNKYIWLKTAKVIGKDSDQMPIIEKTVVKLESVNSFPKFVEHLHLHGYMLGQNPPTIVKVISDGESIDEIEKYQKVVDAHLLKVKTPVLMDYKKELQKANDTNVSILDKLEALTEKLEKQSEEIETLKAEKTSVGKLSPILEAKANELNIQYRSNISDNGLLKKIIEVEPNYKS